VPHPHPSAIALFSLLGGRKGVQDSLRQWLSGPSGAGRAGQPPTPSLLAREPAVSQLCTNFALWSGFLKGCFIPVLCNVAMVQTLCSSKGSLFATMKVSDYFF